MLAKPPENAYNPNGPKAPGEPGEGEDFKDPNGGENWVRNPNGRGYGWEGADGGVWCPTGLTLVLRVMFMEVCIWLCTIRSVVMAMFIQAVDACTLFNVAKR